MAHSLSARKRVRQNEKRRARNRVRKSMIKTQIKHFEEAVREGNAEKATDMYRLCQKKLDKVAATSTMHKNTVARKKSRLSRMLKELKKK